MRQSVGTCLLADRKNLVCVRLPAMTRVFSQLVIEPVMIEPARANPDEKIYWKKL
jgi:hypothetical protein